jgi:hypothetical protein
MGSDTRDLGYVIGPLDEDFPLDPKALERVAYERQWLTCRDEAAKRLGKDAHEVTYEDLQGDLIIPKECLSARGIRTRDAVIDLLILLADFAPNVNRQPALDRYETKSVDPFREQTFEARWLEYRNEHLLHWDAGLTKWMRIPPFPDEGEEHLRDNTVFPSDDLKPRKFRELGAGIATELRTGTPLWLGIEQFVSRDVANHNRSVLLLDSLAWGVQVRLPLENEMGEHPVGVAFDVGPGIPVPVSELFDLSEIQIYLGVRFRGTYTAQSVFETEARHALEFGFGGIAADFIVGNVLWFGVDAPRILYKIDFWEDTQEWQPYFWGFSGGIAHDAF